jgi:hypothetical protein
MPVSGVSEPPGPTEVHHGARVWRDGHSSDTNSWFTVPHEESPLPAAGERCLLRSIPPVSRLGESPRPAAGTGSPVSRLGGSPTGSENTGVTASLHWLPRRKSMARCWGSSSTPTFLRPSEPPWQKSLARCWETMPTPFPTPSEPLGQQNPPRFPPFPFQPPRQALTT